MLFWRFSSKSQYVIVSPTFLKFYPHHDFPLWLIVVPVMPARKQYVCNCELLDLWWFIGDRTQVPSLPQPYVPSALCSLSAMFPHPKIDPMFPQPYVPSALLREQGWGNIGPNLDLKKLLNVRHWGNIGLREHRHDPIHRTMELNQWLVVNENELSTQMRHEWPRLSQWVILTD